MGGKRGVSRNGTRLVVVLALTVLGNVGLSGIAAAASRQACSGRLSVVCTTPTHNIKTTTIVVEEVSSAAPVEAPVDSPAVVSAPVVSKVSMKAPIASKASVGASSAVRADHHKDDDEETVGDTEDLEDEDCGEDDIGDAPDADDDDEDCTHAPTPDPCDDADSDDEGEGDEDCGGPAPSEICGDGIDNNANGKVDEDCATPEPPEPPAPPAPKPPKAPVVLPRQIDRLPTTGADVTSLLLIGLTLVAIGGATRIRTRPLRMVFAGQGSAAELILVKYMNHVATQRTIRTRRT